MNKANIISVCHLVEDRPFSFITNCILEGGCRMDQTVVTAKETERMNSVVWTVIGKEKILTLLL